ncbi:hypothetical protein D358_00607 [Enterococcus faecalis RP2S-4]|uniref:Uncharacterized protein n=1 Tax=Enterococcus faecalis RP2S-4 TaxID=1244145 RepID=A0ABC9TPE2_ENTFL|nr:hypothetical protein D358_00607 [Enterococcus faecalis RP2S-4]
MATRLRNSNCQTECVSIFIGYSKSQVDDWRLAGLVGENSLKSLVATTQKC